MDNKTYLGLSRRSWLRGAVGGSIAARWLHDAIAHAEGEGPARRFLMIQRPNGTVPDQWISKGAPGPILKPFESVWSHAVALQGVDSPIAVNNHENGILGLMTGAAVGPTLRYADDYRSTGASIDQIMVKASQPLSSRPIPSLQLACRDLEGGEIYLPNATLSYSAAQTPLYPVFNPHDVYLRLFGRMSPISPDALRRERARRKSALDFARTDLVRTRQQFPTDLKSDLDLYEHAIRELEQGLDSVPMNACRPPVPPGALDPAGDYRALELMGATQFKLVVASFVCDLTRVVTFQWAAGNSSTNFKPLGTANHHATTHQGDSGSRSVSAAIDKWFSEKTAGFISQLATTEVSGGQRLIDSTLVWYVNEISDGLVHSGTDYPFVVFGGNAVGLKQRGRILDVRTKGKTINDVWLSVADALGVDRPAFSTPASGGIERLIAPKT